MNNQIETINPNETGLFTNYIFKAIPMAFDESMSYYETLCGLKSYLKNTILPTVNNNAEALIELQGLYVELKDYVDHYFDNLDVQEEINNKLDDLVENGTLTTLISNYIDPYITEQNSVIQDFKDSVNNDLENMETQINSVVSGSPIPVNDTTDMTDTTKLYLLTTDGYWYYYDGTDWVAGGVYQATEIDDNSINFDKLVQNLQNNISRIPTYTENEGYYVGAGNGSLTANANYFYTSPIYIRKGEIIALNNKSLSTVAIISTTDDESSKRSCVVGSETNGDHLTVWAAPQDCYITICSVIDKLTNLRIYTPEQKISETVENMELINKDFMFNPEYTTTDGKYINQSLTTSNLAPFSITSAIPLLKNQTISFTSYTAENAVPLAECNSNGDLIRKLIDAGDDEFKGYTYTATHDMFVKICGRKTSLLNIKIIKNIPKLIESVEKKQSNILSMFSNITCIGDSLTWSQVYTSSSHSRQAYNTYPEILQKKTNTPTAMLATKGSNASQIWTEYNDSIVQKDNQLTIIYLGTNNGLTDTVDEDIVGDNYNDYADTNTGCYGKLIKKSLDVGSKVILVKIYANIVNKETTNSVIEELSTKFNVPYVENTKFDDLVYHYYPDLSGYNSLHYNDLGYLKFTEQLIGNISSLSNDDLENILPQ